MLRDDLLRDIIGGLTHLQLLIQNRTIARLADLNEVSEHFAKDFLNSLRGLKLENLNRDGNFPAIDLGDKIARVSFQVTSTRLASKIQETIDKFEEHGLNTEYDRVTVVVLGEKQTQYSTITSKVIAFDPDRDVVDIQGLIKELRQLDNARLRKLRIVVEDAGLLARPPRVTEEVAARKICHEFDRDVLKHHWHQEDSVLGFRSALTELTELLGKGTKNGAHVTIPLSAFMDGDLGRELGQIKPALSELRAAFNERVNKTGEIRDDYAFFRSREGADAMNAAKQKVIDKVNVVRRCLGLPEVIMTPAQ